MRWVIGGIAAVSVAVLIWVFALGGIGDIARWASAGQREAQTALAGALRGLRAGEPGAWLTLMSVCAAYGFFHAAGPGHGKLVIGGYGAASKVPMARLVGLSVGASLAQAMTAIGLVAIGAAVFSLGREALTDTAEAVLAPASYAAIALVGVWLCLRGFRHLWDSRFGVHDHAIDDNGHCHTCGHSHGPTQDQLLASTTWGHALGVIASIAIRPCTGAVFLLILCFGFGIPWAGVAGALVMGLGTATLTVLVAIAAVSLRETALAPLQGQAAVRMMGVLEITVGAVVALIATGLVLRFVG